MKKMTLFFIFLLAYGILHAEEKPMITTLSYGVYTLSDGDETVNGSQFLLGFQFPFSEESSYVAGVNSASASGGHKNSDGSTTDIKVQSTSVNGGLRWQFSLGEKKNSGQKKRPLVGGLHSSLQNRLGFYLA